VNFALPLSYVAVVFRALLAGIIISTGGAALAETFESRLSALPHIKNYS
jgi:hypothetical protein